jgi:hypothetical protein
LRVSFVPRLDERIRGDRRVQVIARDSQASSGSTDEGSHVSVASFDVRVVPRLPAAVEAEPATGAVSPPAAGLPYRERHAAVRLLADGRRSGELLRLLGNARVRVRAAGALRNGGQTIGATLLLELPVARRNVSATLPGYVPGTGRDTPYLSRSVQWGASALRDLLLDVDLQRRRIISVEPGPASVTTSWSAKDPPAREGLAADPAKVPDIPARPPRLVRVSDGGPAFLAYDGDLGLDPRRHDWPVSLVFAGRATVGKVKNALRPLGFTRLGFTRYLAYRPLGAGATLRFDGDRGLKTHCDAAGTDVHIRFYAPAATDRFADAKLGSVVVATSHLDHNDGCGTGPARYGFSGIAERRIGLLARRLGWRVEPNRLTLGNAESYRRDVGDPSHLWLGDGRATLIWVP